MIAKLLIANRGEIACRIIRTARAMGVQTVAIYSDADAKALHVRQADEAVHIGPSPAAESYLRGGKIIAAAKATNADAIHPGYGFLSENADFARAVIGAGLIWVGPRPESIEAMGLKDAAKKLMRAAGVPVTPGYEGEDQSVGRLRAEADAIGYPVLIKAVAGGGGKGMRKVDAPEDFAAMLESCRREAKASFSNDQVLLEKWITSPRHIEVQVFGDAHGNVVHLFERDCSLQRRHQKVIEEAPAPGMDEATRQAICAAAVRAAQAVNYQGAGTIEFIADASEGLSADRIFFMEMNTRLQVEHPVTEMITGVDLVEWQLRVASGEPLPLRQDQIAITGHAIEARVYAEVPWRDFLPSIGRIDHLRTSEPQDEDAGYRFEFGVEEGGEVSPYYDPMIAKLVAHAADRPDAVQALYDMVRGVMIWPLQTNIVFLRRLLMESEFRDRPVDTGFIARNIDDLTREPEPNAVVKRGAAKWFYHRATGTDTTASDRREAAEKPLGGWVRSLVDIPPFKPEGLNGFRLNAAPDTTARVVHRGKAERVSVQSKFGDAHAIPVEIGGQLVVHYFGEHYAFTDRVEAAGGGASGDGDIVAPMPGKVIAVDVAEGDAVIAGQRLLVLEAMKMEHALIAPFDGVVADLNASQGAQVQVDAVLARVEKTAG